MARAAVLPERERGVCCPPSIKVRPERVAGTTELLKALADPTRLQMAIALRDTAEAVCICDFTATFDLGQPTISHHMGRLRAAGLVESEKRGLWIYYRLRRDLTPATVGLIDAVVADAPAVSRRRTARPAPAAPA